MKIGFTSSSIDVSHLTQKVFRLFLLCMFFLNLTACGEKNAEQQYEEALTYIQNGDRAAAIVSLKSVIEKSPRWHEPRFVLGKQYLIDNNFESASKELQKARNFGHRDPQINPLLAMALHRSKANVALADFTYDKSSINDEQHLEILFRQIDALMTLNKQNDALSLIEASKTMKLQSPYKKMIKAYELAISGKQNEAILLANEVAKNKPANPDTNRFAAKLNIQSGDINSAIVLYKKYVDLVDDDVEAKFILANMLITTQPIQAEKYLDDLLSIYPKHGALNQLKSLSRAANEDYKGSVKYAETALSSGRSDLNLRLILGASYFKLAKYDTAVRHLSVVAESLKDDHPALRMLAYSHLQIEQGEQAGLLLSQIEQASDKDLPLLSQAGLELVKAGNFKAAEKIIATAESTFASPEQLIQLGSLKLSMNDIEGLIDIENALKNTSTELTVNARETLAAAYLATAEYTKAISLAKNWQQEQVADVKPYVFEAKIWIAQAQYDKAQVAIDKAFLIDSNNTQVLLAQANINIEMAEFDKAMINVNKVLKEQSNNSQALEYYLSIKLNTDDAASAFERIRTAHEESPDSLGLSLLFARVTILNQYFDKALEVLNTVDANITLPNQYWELKGMAFMGSARYAEAEVHYSAWREFFPTKVRPTIALMNALSEQNRYAEAAKVAADFNKNNENTQIELLHAYFAVMSKDTTTAKQILAGLNEQYKNLAFTKGVRARIALLEGRGSAAIIDAKKSYEANIRPENLQVYVQTLESAGKTQEALDILKLHLKQYPNDGRSKSLFAEKLLARDKAAALAVYEELIGEYPNNPVFLNNAAYLHLLAENFNKALEYSASSYELSPSSVSFTNTYAQALRKNGQTAKSVDTYNTVMTPDVSDEDVILNYIEVLFENNNAFGANKKIQEYRSKLRSKTAKKRLFVLQTTYSK